MKREIALHERWGIVRLARRLHRAQRVHEIGKLFRCSASRCELGGEGLTAHPYLDRLEHMAPMARHPSQPATAQSFGAAFGGMEEAPPAVTDFHQLQSFQKLQRLAHRTAADAKQQRKASFTRQPILRLEAAFADQL